MSDSDKPRPGSRPGPRTGPRPGPRTGKPKRRQARAAAAKRSPAETSAAKPEPAVDEPAAPVGFTGRAAGGDGKPEAAAKKSLAGVAVLVAAIVAVVAVGGYLTRATWLPGPPGAGGRPAAVAEKPMDKPAEKPAEKPADKAAGKPADKPIEAAKSPPPVAAAPPAVDDAQLDALTKEREQLRAELNRLIGRLDGVEKSMDSAKKMIRATASPADKIAGAPALDQLSERVGALEQSEAAVKDLMKRVEKMEKDSAGGDGARAVVLAVSGLNDAVARGEPFATHLEALKAVAGGNPNIKAAAALLAKGADTGIPTLTQLRDRFDGLAGRIVGAAKAGDDRGWMTRAVNRVSSLVTWRRVGDGAKDDSVDAVVARAEARLKAGDLAGAVKTLDALAANKNAAAAAEPWLADAKARVTAERAVASLHVHAVSLLAPTKP